MATSGLLVAAIAVPVCAIAFLLRPKGEPLLQPWKPVRAPWIGLHVAIAFVFVSFFAPVFTLDLLTKSGFYQQVYGPEFPPPKELAEQDLIKEANALRMLWASVFATPLQIAALVLAARLLYPRWRLPRHGSVASKVCVAVLAWLAITPVVLLLHTAVNAISTQLGAPPESHPLAKLGNRPLRDQLLLMVEVCLGAPLREEFVLRGVLLWWCVRRTQFFGSAPWQRNLRPLIVMLFAVLFAVLSERLAAVVFAAVLLLGFAVLWKVKRVGARRSRAIYASATLFALMHSVWPSPIPLFVLGLALGWLAVRTNGVLVPVIVHGLFNAVSGVFVLRSAG